MFLALACGAPCARRSEPAPTSHSRTWRSDSSSPAPVDQSDAIGRLDRALLCSPTGGLGGARRSIRRPETVIPGTAGLPRFWTGSPSRRVGRHGSVGDCGIVRTMALANPLWGAPRIHGEIAQSGLTSRSEASPLMPRRMKPPRRLGSTFLQNHLADSSRSNFFDRSDRTFRCSNVGVLAASSPPNRAFNVTVPDRRLDPRSNSSRRPR